MTQFTLFDPHHNELTPDFDGKTYDRELDHDRLDSALAKVYRLMLDGQWRTIAQIAESVGCSETGASARLRDLRKEKWQSLRSLPRGIAAMQRARVVGLSAYQRSVTMQLKVARKEATFRPVEVTIYLDTQAEADALYAMLASTCIVESVQSAFGVSVPYMAALDIPASASPCNKLTDAVRSYMKRNSD